MFAKVVSGIEVVDKIAQTPTGNAAGHSDVPIEDMIIEKAEVID